MSLGSIADAAQGLRPEIEQLERQFTIDTKKLKEITDHFVSELEKGSWRFLSKSWWLWAFSNLRQQVSVPLAGAS